MDEVPSELHEDYVHGIDGGDVAEGDQDGMDFRDVWHKGNLVFRYFLTAVENGGLVALIWIYLILRILFWSFVLQNL